MVLVKGQSTPSTIAQTIPLDAAMCEETKEEFTEVSSAFQDMSVKQEQIQEGGVLAG